MEVRRKPLKVYKGGEWSVEFGIQHCKVKRKKKIMDNYEVFECPFTDCAVYFMSERDYRSHMQEHSKTKSGAIICTVCGIACSSEGGAAYHASYHGAEKYTIVDKLIKNKENVLSKLKYKPYLKIPIASNRSKNENQHLRQSTRRDFYIT